MGALRLAGGSQEAAEKISSRLTGVLPVHGEVKSLKPLTLRQFMALAFIADQVARFGDPPTLREIGKHMCIRSTNGVNDHLRALERKGCIVRRDGLARAMRVTVEGYAALEEEE